MSKTILLVAGGTGGHVFPALALRELLIKRGHDVHIATDRRVGAFIDGVDAGHIHTIRSATLSGHPLKLAASLWRLASGLLESRRLLKRMRPGAVVGFGGYPSVPPVTAARLSGIPALVHALVADLRPHVLSVVVVPHLFLTACFGANWGNGRGIDRSYCRRLNGSYLRATNRP